MKTAFGLAIVTVVVCVSGAAATNGPTRIMHTPPANAVLNEPVRFTVTLDGVSGEEPDVLLFYRGRGSRAYYAQKLEARGEGRWSATVPADRTGFLELVYYIEVKGPIGSYVTVIGSPTEPLTVPLRETPAKSGQNLAAHVALPLAVIFAVMGAFWIREHRRRRALIDELFWVQMLTPILTLDGPSLSKTLTHLTRQSIDHPLRGPVMYARPFLHRKLAQVRATDLGALTARRDHVLGAKFTLETPSTMRMLVHGDGDTVFVGASSHPAPQPQTCPPPAPPAPQNRRSSPPAPLPKSRPAAPSPALHGSVPMPARREQPPARPAHAR